MGLLRRILGPASKYDGRIPYTYEARVPVAGVEGMVQTYLSDTLCGLLEALDAAGVRPDEPAILEVRPDGEIPVSIEHCVGPEGRWLRRPAACESFRRHYAGHVAEGRCGFTDRSRAATGPIVEIAR